MPTLNADVPVFDCLIRREYLYNLERHHGEVEPCTVFGVSSIEGRALGFWVLIHSTGAVIGRLPVSALCTEADAPHRAFDVLQTWSAFSYELAVHEFGHLAGRRCLALLRDQEQLEATYRFTIDYYGSSYAENAGDGGWKCHHVLELDDGCLALLPNNRILWSDPAVIPEPFKERPDYITNGQEWWPEGATKWVAEDTDRMFYGVESVASDHPAMHGQDNEREHNPGRESSPKHSGPPLQDVAGGELHRDGRGVAEGEAASHAQEGERKHELHSPHGNGTGVIWRGGILYDGS
jgi:hypothetical protein